MNNAYQNGSNIFEDHQNKNEVTRIKKQVINNEPVVSIDIYSIAYLFKNWFYEVFFFFFFFYILFYLYLYNIY